MAPHARIPFVVRRYAPRFIRPSADGGLRECGLFEMLRISIDGTARRNGFMNNIAESKAFLESAPGFGSGPIVMFPETVRTNNKCILSLSPCVAELGALANSLEKPPIVHVRCIV